MQPLPCPFCGRPVDLTDGDTLYPNGTAWEFNEELQGRVYRSAREVVREQWCWSMHCPESSGGCGAEMSGNSREDALNKWNTRTVID